MVRAAPQNPAKCVFCAIVAEQETASRIFEDDDIIAFMDIRPIRPGQLLIVPKQHIDHFDDLPENLALRILLFGQRISRVLRQTLKPRRVGMIVHGFGVPHAHLVVLPLEHSWDITAAQFGYIEDGVIKFKWEQVPIARRSELDALAATIAQRLDPVPGNQG